jgi:ATP adenylyltransferase/5',5'''-P-1,P-4-tetraphosphate phosphorylase II
MEFRICPALATKPHTVGATNPAFNYSRKWGPGSDMYCPDERLILTKLNGTHDLALNLFCVDRPQLLILTLDSYRRQHEPLDDTDLTVSLEVLKRFPSMYIIFNCGEQGGCSRVHKHLQGLWGPPYAFNSLTGGFGQNVPFRYFARHLQPGFKDASAVDIASMYSSLLGQSRKILGLSANEACPHNVILWDDWIIVIPRRRGGFGKASANAGGMLGSVWVQSQEQVDEWLQIGCANVLRELGVSPAEVDLLSTKPTAS